MPRSSKTGAVKEPASRAGALSGSGRVWVAPATYAQEHERNFCIHGRAYDSAVVVLRVEGSLDTERMVEALHALVRHHEVLRTALVHESGRVVQAIHSTVELNVEVLKLAEHGFCSRSLTHLIRSLARRPFDLERPPLFRARIISIARLQHLVCLALPHVVHDGRGLRIIADDLLRYYDGADPPASDCLQLADFASWQRGAVEPRMVARWHETLTGASGHLSLPLDRNAVGVRFSPEFLALSAAGPGLMGRLARRATAARTTIAVALAASFSAALFVLTSGQHELCFGFQVAGREHSELADVCGQLFDVLPVRIRARPETTLSDLLAATSENLHQAYASPVPGLVLLRLLEAPYDASINVRPALPTLKCPARLEVREIASFENVTFFPGRGLWWGAQLSLSVDLRANGGMTGDLSFNTASVDRSLAARLVTVFRRAVQCSALFPQMSLERFAEMTRS